MRGLILFFTALMLFLPLKAQVNARFMSEPDIRGNEIIFTYEGDLWKADINGQSVRRITSFPGIESDAKFSPDGKWIAFTGTYDGLSNVYLMSAKGGEAKRLTWNPSGGQMVAWSVDSKSVVFKSYWEVFVTRTPKLYTCDLKGSLPQKLPPDKGVNCSFSDDGSLLYYSRKGREEYQWKRYRGGDYVDIWSYDFNAKKFTALTDFVGKNAYPMSVGQNKIAYVCDKEGVSNLYIMDNDGKNKQSLTSFKDYDVRYPSSDGKNIVYVQNGYLNIYSVESKNNKKLELVLDSDRWKRIQRKVNPLSYLHYVSAGDKNNEIAVEARGDIYLVNGKGFVKNLSKSPSSREMYPTISSQGDKLAYFSDKSGEYQLYVLNLKSNKEEQLTKDLKSYNYEVYWSPDGKKLLFGDKSYNIYIYDLANKQLKLIAEQKPQQVKNDQFYWKMSDYGWSPDSNWVTYSLVAENKNSVIYVYSLVEGKTTALTDDFYDNLNPVFDFNGKYLYYLSSRNFNIGMDFYEDNHVIKKPQKIICVQLQKDDEKKSDKKRDKVLKIDFDGIKKRQFPLKVKAGNYFHLKAGKGMVAWSAKNDFTEGEYEDIFEPRGHVKWTLHVYNVEAKKENILKHKISSLFLSNNREKAVVKVGKSCYLSSLEKIMQSNSFGKKIDFSAMSYDVEPLKEWEQIFDDVWRWYRDFFYDVNMHGRDWADIGKRYKEMIPFVSSRSALNDLLSQMVGELCVGHAYIGGGDYSPFFMRKKNNFYPHSLGVEVKNDGSNYYKIAKVFGPDEYNLSLNAPLRNRDVNIKEGNYLIALNGKEIKSGYNYFKELQLAGGSEIEITVNSTPNKAGAKTYKIKPVVSERSLRYNDWLSHNINKVLKESNGEFGYMHINGMGSGGIAEFDKFWRAFKYKKGIIIDVRRNNGGWTEYFLIDKLERVLTARNNLRVGTRQFKYPSSASMAKYIVISNEDNASDGEAFVEHFKARFGKNGRGKVIGTPSWGGLVGIINMQKTIDNGYVHQPNNGFYGKDGKWWVENKGGTPDIFVDNDPASALEGKDKQLDEAIKELKKMVGEEEEKFPSRPNYPKR